MANLASSFIETAITFVCFIGIAYAGILCGKKYRDSKDAKKAS